MNFQFELGFITRLSLVQQWFRRKDRSFYIVDATDIRRLHQISVSLERQVSRPWLVCRLSLSPGRCVVGEASFCLLSIVRAPSQNRTSSIDPINPGVDFFRSQPMQLKCSESPSPLKIGDLEMLCEELRVPLTQTLNAPFGGSIMIAKQVLVKP